MATVCEEDYEEDFDFREIVEESVKESLIEEIEEEWENLYHNASLHNWPDFENDYEAELFWNVLSDEGSWRLEEAEQEIETKFGVEVKLYSWGRSGATIAPDKWMAPCCCGGFGGLVDISYEEVEDLDAMLAVLRYINTQVHDFCNHIDEWWKDVKEQNEWDKEIAEHNEKS